MAMIITFQKAAEMDKRITEWEQAVDEETGDAAHLSAEKAVSYTMALATAREEAEDVRLPNMLLAHGWRLEPSGDFTLDNNSDRNIQLVGAKAV